MYTSITATDWDEAFLEQVSRISKESQIARRNNDATDIRNLEKWLEATRRAHSLYQEGVNPQDIPSQLRTSFLDLNFPECEEFLEALESDDFELMLLW
jgi:hypothetical protein